MKLTSGENQFWRGEKPHRIFSGALHYFRVLPEYWEDRLLKFKACGLNTVETYVAWNLHEPQPGVFCFEGLLDLRRFVELAGSIGLDVIVRPGPYICAEFDFGGLPGWLLADPGMKVRTLHDGYVKAVERYMPRLLKELEGLYSHEGGPIIAMQVENEYGSYGCDHPYMLWNKELLQRCGVEAFLFTSDGPEDGMLQGGHVPGVLRTANFGSHAIDAFSKLKEYEPDQPAMCMEFWNGWFDHWGEPHHGRPAEVAAAALEEILSAGGSVNVYMMHGGTNFGFWNGANHDGRYRPTVSSYDYDAPIDEQGRPTAKYYAFREVFARHGAEVGPVPGTVTPQAYGEVRLKQAKNLFSLVEGMTPLKCQDTLTMEEAGQNFGYILYRTHVQGPRPARKLFLQEVRDRAWIYQDGRFLGIVERDGKQGDIEVAIPEGGSRLDIVVENLGRVNYGPELHDRKGITRGVRLSNQYLAGWEIYPLDFSALPAGFDEAPKGCLGEPQFFTGEFEVGELSDTFLRVEGVHGAAWINGFCLGRYWNVGPQETLYVPAPLLKRGMNSLTVFEFEPGEVSLRATLCGEASLNGKVKALDALATP